MSQYPGQFSRAISQTTACRKKYLAHVRGKQNYETINPDGPLTGNISTNYCHRSFHSSLLLQVCTLAQSFPSKRVAAFPTSLCSPARSPNPLLPALCHQYLGPAVLTPRWGSCNCIATILD